MKFAYIIAVNIALLGVAQAQVPVSDITAEKIVQILAEPAVPAGLSRSMGRRVAAEPDPLTHRCSVTGETAEDSTGAQRNLVVTNSPKLDLAIAFELDSAAIRGSSQALLAALAQAMQSPELGNARFVIAGHTDKRGSDGYNKSLSCERALAVREYLARRHGIAKQRLIPLGFGFDRLLDPYDPESEVNRRVEIRKY